MLLLSGWVFLLDEHQINNSGGPFWENCLNTADTCDSVIKMYECVNWWLNNSVDYRTVIKTLCVFLTQPAVTVELAWGRWVCKLPDWRSRWSPRWLTGPHSSPRSPGPDSGAGCSRTGWSGRPVGEPGQTEPHNFQPVQDRNIVSTSYLSYSLLKPRHNNTIIHFTCCLQDIGVEKLLESESLGASDCVCVPHPAGWFAGVFREAEQQVENRPAMLQNSLSNR